MKRMKFLFVFAFMIVVFGTLYVTVQQSLRFSANDPQIQMAQDAAQSLNNGTDAHSISAGKVDLTKSIAPFITVYDKEGNTVAGNGYLDNQIAAIPKGVLLNSDGKDYHAVTWQPKKGVRIAAISVKANDYYVVSGRSLKEVEKREDAAMMNVGVGFVTSVIILGIWMLASQLKAYPVKRKRK